MKEDSSGRYKNQNAEEPQLSLGRRAFVKGIAALGAGVAASPLLSETAQAQVPAQSNAQSQGAGRYVQVEYPPSTAANELQVGVTYVLWIPGGILACAA